MAQLKQFKMQSTSLEQPRCPNCNGGASISPVERYLDALVKEFPLIIFVISPDGVVKHADGAALKSLGIPAKDAIGKNAFELYGKAPWILDAIRSVVREKRPHTASGKLTNGVVDFWYDAQYSPVFDKAGNMIEIIGFAMDVTSEMKQRERARELAEEKIAAMTASMDGIAVIEPSGNLKYVNDSLASIYGFKDASLMIGRNWKTFFNVSEAERLTELVTPLINKQRHWRGEAMGFKASGDHFFLELSLSQIFIENRSTGIVSVVRDITERKRRETRIDFVTQAATALSESLDYEITLKNTANFAVRRFASWCVVTLVNEQGSIERVIVGADPDEAALSVLLSDVPLQCSENYINKKVHLTHRVDQAHEVNQDLLRDLFPAEEERARFEALEISSYICVPLINAGTFLGAITFLKSRKKLNLGQSPYYDEKDSHAAIQVAGRMALAVQNAKLYRETKEAVRSREDLIASVSHDLKNPLCAISINAELISRASETLSRASVFKKLSGTIRASVDRMTALIKELLELEKLRGGEFLIVKAPVSARSLIETAIAEIEPLLLQKSIVLTKKMPEKDVIIQADKERLLQVFSNLLGNALKFCPERGQIWISFENLNQEIKFCVQDTGPGIEKKYLTRVFDRYWRSEMSDKMGAGIGLTIARAIVNSHGGSIWAESVFGHGSTFSFTIPKE